MGYEIPGQMITIPASTVVISTTSANWQYRFVSVSTGGTAIAPTSGEAVLGVMQNKPLVGGEAATVMINGFSKVQAKGSTVSAGQYVQASTAGYAIANATSSFTVGQIVAGSSGSTGRILTVNLSAMGSS